MIKTVYACSGMSLLGEVARRLAYIYYAESGYKVGDILSLNSGSEKEKELIALSEIIITVDGCDQVCCRKMIKSVGKKRPDMEIIVSNYLKVENQTLCKDNLEYVEKLYKMILEAI